jgi:thioredoxin 1
MKKVIFMMLAIFAFAIDWSGKVNWAMGFEAAKNIAAKENKLIMVDVSLSHCPPCQYLATKVYTNDKVASYINKNFVPVFYLADKDNLPLIVQNYFTGSTPTILFIKPNGELYYSFIGARPPQVFLKILQDIIDKYKAGK